MGYCIDPMVMVKEAMVLRPSKNDDGKSSGLRRWKLFILFSPPPPLSPDLASSHREHPSLGYIAGGWGSHVTKID